MTAFAIGDRVRFNDAVKFNWWFKAGQTGVISGFSGPDYARNITVKVDGGGGGCGDEAYVDAHMIDHVVEREFNVGDRIRLLADNDGYGRRGAEGVIEEKQNHTYFVRFDEEYHGSNCWWTVAEDMELRVSYQTYNADEDLEYPDEPAEIDNLSDGYYEPCSSYRACVGAGDKWVVEAVRVKTIAVCADEAEAIRIAEALNFTSGNVEYADNE
jgi:hypothetical protein